MPAWTETRILRGPGAGRAVVRLPLYTRAPYTLRVSSSTRSRTARADATSASSAARQRDASGATRRPPTRPSRPTPTFPIRQITRAQLEASFREAAERRGPANAAPYLRHKARCRTLTTCTLTYTDPLYPDQPYTTRYRIAGEQTPGVWLVTKHDELTEPPYGDIVARGPEAGCVAWPR